MTSYMLEGFQPQGGGLGTSTFGNVQAPNAKQLEVLMKVRELRELFIFAKIRNLPII